MVKIQHTYVGISYRTCKRLIRKGSCFLPYVSLGMKAFDDLRMTMMVMMMMMMMMTTTTVTTMMMAMIMTMSTSMVTTVEPP